MKNFKSRTRLLAALLAGLCILLASSFAVHAAEKNTGWVTKKQCVYYYVENASPLKGLKKIDNAYYYFDKKGIQRTGWQKIGGSYYFFRIANGAGGSMVTSKKINGVKLKKDGKAATAGKKTKLDIMVKANKLVEAASKPTMNKKEKLKKSFYYMKKHYAYNGSPTFVNSANWDQYYAKNMFNQKHGSCYGYGAAFAYVANAVGYSKCYAVCSGGHGWTEVNGKYYDISWDIADPHHYSYFAVPPSLSGVGGRPHYRIARAYVKKI